MLKREYNPKQPYRFVQYGRMSSDSQNRRSPDQQFNTIAETLERCGNPWKRIKTYRDDGISGRKLRQRTGFQKMLHDIEHGLIQVDLIVVDTYERLGRAEEISLIRHKLVTEHGVLVVSADNNFADPTGVVGKALGMVEHIRATENTRVSCHNVIRGKKDTARRKRWPGGLAPFGYTLKPMIDDQTSPPSMYSLLEVEPREAAAQLLVFQRAAATGHRSGRLAKWWNSCLEIPDEFKPISANVMLHRLANRIYVGTLVWGEYCTDVINDTRVVELNPDGAVVVPDFCDPIVDVETFEAVQRSKVIWSKKAREARARNSSDIPGKIIAPQVRGLTLKYLLSGLVRCASCSASMRPIGSGYKNKEGEGYAYYACPRHLDDSCANGKFIREKPLREMVISCLRSRLFPPPDGASLLPAWYPTIVSAVQAEVTRYHDEEPDRAQAREEEILQIERNLNGWTMTLGDPSVPPSLRSDLMVKYEQARSRLQDLKQATQTEEAVKGYLDSMLDPKVVIAHLQRLEMVFDGSNPTLGNLELSKHIDKITVDADGQVELRGTFLGLFRGAIGLLRSDSPPPDINTGGTSDGQFNVVPRRRGRLRVPSLSSESLAALDGIDTDLDPQRFSGVSEEFFWTEIFFVGKKLPWCEEHAAEVARERIIGKKTHAELAAHFGVTPPTIRNALEHAATLDASLKEQPRKMPRQRWHEDHALEVATLRANGMSVIDIAKKFDKTDTTIYTALKHARTLMAGSPDVTPIDSGESR